VTAPGDALTPVQQQALAAAIDGIHADPASLHRRFPAAAREIARSPVAPAELGVVRIEDEVRVRLLEAFAAAIRRPNRPAEDPISEDPISEVVIRLYRHGDADERRAVLLGLHRLPLGDRAVELVQDGLRSNDPRLVVAALGEYGGRYLDAADWRQGVVKCLFLAVPLRLVADLPARCDDTLREMVAGYARERTAAGREVPADARRLLDPSAGSVNQEA
jgi:hypothetical protein